MNAPEQRQAGICGIRLVDGDGRPTTAAARFPTLRVLFGEATGLGRIAPAVFPRHLLSDRECSTTRVVDQVIGAFFLIRRHVFEALGGFDERFFVYFEEVDLSYRAKAAGWRSMYFAGAEALHHGGLSSDQVKAARLFYTMRSRLLYADKHYSPLSAWSVRAITMAIERPIRLARARLLGGAAIDETATAYARLRAFLATPDWRRNATAQRRP
jgi:N-acetylglucosaminyl-diphospho-decaprenol L-rhamnosyltransferase